MKKTIKDIPSSVIQQTAKALVSFFCMMLDQGKELQKSGDAPIDMVIKAEGFSKLTKDQKDRFQLGAVSVLTELFHDDEQYGLKTYMYVCFGNDYDPNLMLSQIIERAQLGTIKLPTKIKFVVKVDLTRDSLECLAATGYGRPFRTISSVNPWEGLPSPSA